MDFYKDFIRVDRGTAARKPKLRSGNGHMRCNHCHKVIEKGEMCYTQIIIRDGFSQEFKHTVCKKEECINSGFVYFDQF